MCHTNLKNTPKLVILSFKKIVIFNIGLSCWFAPKLWIATKAVFATKTRQGHEFVICTKMQLRVLFCKWRGFLLKTNKLPQFYMSTQILEIVLTTFAFVIGRVKKCWSYTWDISRYRTCWTWRFFIMPIINKKNSHVFLDSL